MPGDLVKENVKAADHTDADTLFAIDVEVCCDRSSLGIEFP